MARPTDYLTPDEMARLRVKSDLIGIALVAHAWALVFGSMALFAAWPNPLTFIVAVMVIGARQLGIAILMHDAAHGLLCANRRLNDFLGIWFCGAPVAASLKLYRPYHLAHHRHTQRAEDPDLGLSAPFPISKVSLRRKIIRDLTGRTGFERRKAQVLHAMGPPDLPLMTRLQNLWRVEQAAILTNLILLLGLAAIGYWWLYPVLWLLPNLTWYQLVSRIRNIAEHAVVPDNEDPLRNTRTTYANPFMRLLLAPYWVNYHLEHHLFLFVPCWRLPAAHRLLLEKGFGPRMEVQPGYRAVLALATSASVDRTGGRRAAGVQHI